MGLHAERILENLEREGERNHLNDNAGYFNIDDVRPILM